MGDKGPKGEKVKRINWPSRFNNRFKGQDGKMGLQVTRPKGDKGERGDKGKKE